MTNRPSSENPHRSANPLMRSASSASAKGVNLLNNGAITVGNNHSTARLKTAHTPQAHSHQKLPALSISHNTTATRGSPSIAPRSAPLTRSEEHTSELQSRENLVC